MRRFESCRPSHIPNSFILNIINYYYQIFINYIMNENNKRLIKILAYAGLLPFIISIIFSFSNYDPFFLTNNLLIHIYGTIIVSFLAGIHWGISLLKYTSYNLLIHSNIIAVLSWFSFFLDHSIGIFLLIFSFLYLLCIDYNLYRKGILEYYYMSVRVSVTFLVISCLIVDLVFYNFFII
jgi:hypothetical protein